ncbi:MAG: HugZ family protein [Rhodospirillaceae bacterium]|jgi:heme iron utilization protein|nr:HugZ family protein [Rhodospirillaceae bacterium]MBT5458796.1 HugZ family protein [Rhodospirillaceae bacterium]
MALPKSELGAQARALVRATDRAALASALKQDGWPYASLVMIACDFEANPLLMISELAEHTQNILSEDRVSLLIDGTVGLENPLTGARVTLVGHAVKCDQEDLAARYVARHPDAALYGGFADFALYRVTVERVHMVAGFGAIHWIEASDFRGDAGPADELRAAEGEIITHMNDDHEDAVQLYATVLAGHDCQGWTMTGLDPEGFDLRCGGTVTRIDFEQPVGSAEEARAALVKLVHKARKDSG